MNSLKELLKEYEARLQDLNCPILKKMNDGLSRTFAFNLLKKEGTEHENLVELYSWKNGIENFSTSIIGEMELFPSGIMQSLEDALETYKMHTHQLNLWEENLFPIFTDGGGDYLLFDLNRNSQTYEMVFIYAPMLLLDEKAMTIYDSLEHLFKTELECLKSGAYNFNSNGIDEIDYDLLYAIAAKNNPNSKYWDDHR